MATKKKPDEERRHQYAMAVLTGIYASNGKAILEATTQEYTEAQALACRVAYDQADHCLRTQGGAQ